MKGGDLGEKIMEKRPETLIMVFRALEKNPAGFFVEDRQHPVPIAAAARHGIEVDARFGYVARDEIIIRLAMVELREKLQLLHREKIELVQIMGQPGGSLVVGVES